MPRSLRVSKSSTADMPSLDRVTPAILTYDEEPNIGRTLACLTWANRVVVVDSGSRDRTAEIVESFDNTELLRHPFDSHRNQWNYTLRQVETEWALTLDADYHVPEEFVREMREIPDKTDKNGFFVSFHYKVMGRTLKRSLYPPKQVLVRVDAATFIQDVDTERVRVDGESGELQTPIVHDDRKSLRRWLENQAKYAQLAAQKLTSTPWCELSWTDRLRKTRILAPPTVLVYCLLGKGLILDGSAGWYYTLERVTAEMVISLQLIRSVFDSEES